MPNQSKTSILLQQKQQAASQDTSPEQLRELAHTSKTLMLRVAENNAAPPELLRELAVSSKAVCERVAANPNTPTDVLLKLGAKFPKQLLSNPILPLLLLENPNLVENIPLNTLISLLKQEQVPDYILNAASKHHNEDILILVASHINTSKTALEHLSQSHYAKVQEVAKLHVNLVKEIELDTKEVAQQVILNFNPVFTYEVNQEDLAIAQLIPDFLLPNLHNKILYTIALHPNTPTHVLKILCGKNFYSSIHEYVVSNPNIPVNLIESVAEYYNKVYSEAAAEPESYIKRYAEQVFGAIVSNPNTPVHLIEKLYQYPSDFIHARVAANLNTPVKLLDFLANSKNTYVRSCVATNPNTSINSLKKLCVDQDNWIRFSVGGNIKMPANLLQILAQDKGSNIRHQIASHPNTPKSVLSLLAQDENEWIRCNVAKNPNITVDLLSALATEKSYYIRHAVARNSNTPTSLLKILAKDENYLVRQAVASNPNTPTYLLQELALSQYRDIRLALANNSNTPQNLINEELIQEFPQQIAQNLATPANILIELAKHPDQSVRALIAANTNTPLETLEILARDRKYHVRHRAANNPKMPTEQFAKITLERIAKTLVPSFSRFIVFLHAQAPQQALIKNYRSESWLERYAIAQNPNTPKHILNELTSDANQIVRAAAYNAIKHIV